MNVEEEIRIFLNRLCVDFGICNPLYDLERFVSKEHYEVNEFIREVFMSEEMDPDLNLKLFRQVKRIFTEQFGSEIF
jgi:hypothetical protein